MCIRDSNLYSSQVFFHFPSYDPIHQILLLCFLNPSLALMSLSARLKGRCRVARPLAHPAATMHAANVFRAAINVLAVCLVFLGTARALPGQVPVRASVQRLPCFLLGRLPFLVVAGLKRSCSREWRCCVLRVRMHMVCMVHFSLPAECALLLTPCAARRLS